MSKTIPARKDVPAKDKWDLSSIFNSDSEWESALTALPALNEKVTAFKGKLGDGPDTLLAALCAYKDALLKMECVYHYASLQHEADEDGNQIRPSDGQPGHQGILWSQCCWHPQGQRRQKPDWCVGTYSSICQLSVGMSGRHGI